MFKNPVITLKGKTDLFLSVAAAALALLSVALPITTAGLEGPQSAGEALATSSFEQRVLPVHRFGLDTASAAAFAISSSNSRAAIVDSLRSELKIVETQSGALVTSRRLAESPSLVALDDQGTIAVVGYSRSNDLSIIGVEDSSLDRNVSLPSPPGRLRLASTVRKAIVTLPTLNAIAVVDLRSGVQTLISVDRNPSGLDFDPATNAVLVSSYDDGTLSIISLLTNSVAASVPIGLRPADVALDSSSGIAYVACEGSGLIERFDFVRRTPIGTLNSEIISGLSRLAIFPEIPRGRVRGLLVASSNEDHSLAVFNLVKGTPWRIATAGAMSDLAPSAVTGEVLALGARNELLALDLRQISAPVLAVAELLSPKNDNQKEFVLHGNNFVPGPNGQSGIFTVIVGNTPATSAQLVDNSTARVSWLGKLRRVPIQVVTANGESNTVFLHDPEIAPGISGVTPALGPEIGGTSCTVKGNNFLDGSPGSTTVFFGLSPATDVVIVDDHTLTCTAPAGANKVSVNVQNDQGISARPGDYIYLPADMAINDATVVEGNSGTVTAVFTVTLSSPNASTVTVDYVTSDGTACEDCGDYNRIFSPVTLTFAPGETSKTISIIVNGDTFTEPNETFFVDLSNPTNATILDGAGQGTIINDDGAPSLSITDASVLEGNSGTKAMTFTVSLSPAHTGSVTVNYATVTNTAFSPSDYLAASGSVGFLPGETAKTVNITINGDTVLEATESFFVNLSGATGAPISDFQGVGTITNDDVPPTLSIDDVTVTEGDTGTANAIFTVTLSSPSTSPVMVNYATANGTAFAGSDYVAQSSVLSFSPGATTLTIAVPVNGDTVDEPDENFFVNLSSPLGATIADGQGIGTITDNDLPPTFSINDVTITEGNAGTVSATFTVTLSPAAGTTVTVNYATADGTALGGNDYVSQTGTLTFSPGATTRTITVVTNGDTLDEPNENFFINLSSASSPAVIGDGQGVGTINDNDLAPSLSIDDVTALEGDFATSNAIFNVTLSSASGQTVTVNYATANITATAGSDYVSASGTVTFAPGITSQIIDVVVNGDTLDEPNETFFVNLSSPTNATISDSQGIGTITDDDAPPSLSINDVTVTEGDTGTVNANFTVTLSAASGQTVTVNYATADGTATTGIDYGHTPTPLTFPPGTTTQNISVAVSGDTLDEPNETFFINLSSPTNATISDSQGIGTITDDDGPPSLSISDVTDPEGVPNINFGVTLSAPSGQTVTVAYTTANGTATAGSDYATTSGTLTFSPGTTSRSISVLLIGDTLNEPDETFFVNLSSPTNATISDGQGIGTITDDDAEPTLSINDITVTEGNTGTVNAVFTATLSAASGQTVTVAYTTADSTATAGSDYVSTSGTLTFSPGTTTQTITVLVNGDTLDEPATETFFVNLSSPTNATISDSQGIGTITDNDFAPSLSIGDATLPEGNTGTTNFVFTVTLSAPSGQTVTVNYSTIGGGATPPGDFASTSGTLTFNPGITSQNITVLVNGDTLNEQDETFSVPIFSATNASISDSVGLGTITNDDGLPSLSIGDATVTEGNAGTTNAVFTVTLSPASGQTVTVSYATADGTAIAPGDYATTGGTLTFSPGSTTQNITVAVNGDTLSETNEDFFVNLSSPTNATISDSQGLGTITNDDGAPSISINDITVLEGNSGPINAVFAVTLSAPSSQTITVNTATANGTAIAPGDYTTTGGTVTFIPGSTSQNITVVVNGDTLDEPNETFFVNLSSPANATISDGQGIGTITDDDGPPSLSINDVTGPEGAPDISFNVTLSAPSGQTVTVAYTTANGTATAGSDYISSSGTLTFSPGTTSQSISVQLVADTLNEPTENFFVNLTSPVSATISDGQGIGTITDDDGLPALSINDVTMLEGTSGTENAVFSVTLSAASGQTVMVNYATANGSAVAPGDYAATSGTLTFSPGTTTQNITVVVSGDTLSEPDETFFVNLSGPTNATIADSQGLGTITNDDGVPTLSITDVSLPEGNTGTQNAVFTVTLSAISSQTVTVNYATADGTALALTDFATTGGTLTFSPGSTTQSITVVVNGDTVSEPDETFFVNLSGATNATISDSQGVGTITNDDGVPSISINDVTVLEGDGGEFSATFTVSLSAASSQTVTVNYATSDGTAVAPGDYFATSGTLIFSPGTTSQAVFIGINGDTISEANETYFVNLSGAVNATISDNLGVGTITNDDGIPSISINDVTLAEGSGTTTTPFIFTVSLSASSGQTVTVNYATANGTAVAPGDYVSTSGTLTFSPGTTTQNISITVDADYVNEPNETFFVNLSGPTNATISDSQGVGTITNDDGIPSISINDVTLAEGSGGGEPTSFVFAVSLSASSGQTVTVNYATANGTAVAPGDYLSTSGTLTFNPGTTVQNLFINVVADSLNEPNETFFVNLSAPTNATISDGQGVGTIVNDDVAVSSLSIGDATVTEGNSGTTNAIFAVVLSPASGQTVTVNYATANGTALAPGDYASTSGTLTFSPGSTTQNITVAVNGDTLSEANETFTVNLTGPVNATISDGQGVGTILDDDVLPSLTIDDATVTEGNSGTVNAVFTVTLSSNPAGLVTVNFATANGTATEGTDYVAISGTLTFGPGNTSQNIVVPVNGDTLNEPTETFFVNLSNPTNAGISDDQGLGTIVNDDSAPLLSINDVTLSEGNAGTVNAVFAVTLSTASAVPVTVNFATADGTASAGTDYGATSGVLTFPPGSTIQNITVAVQGDTLLEPDETFFVNLSNPINAAIADGTGVGTITNDDAVSTLSISDAVVVEGNPAVFTVSLSAPAAGAVTVAFATADGSALAGSDYVATSGTLTFPAGSTVQTINVTVLADSLSEATETFSVNLSSPVNATIADGLGIGTILDGGGSVQFSSASYTIGEAGGSATITVTRTGGQGGGVQVNYAATNGTATAGADYTAVSGTLTFGAGETSQSFTVPIIDDSVFEGNETVNLALSSPTGAALGSPSTAVLTITDNEPAPGGVLQFSATAYSVNEDAGSAIITVTRTGSSTGAVSVNYSTSNGTATAGSDYTSVSGTLSFAAGETSGTFSIPILDDFVAEANETVNLALSAPSGGAGLGSPIAAILTILNDDNPAPIISGLTPITGSLAGGTFVRVSGRHFVPGITVRFGGALASNIQLVDENALTLTTPPGAGTVDVSVTTINGSASLPQAYTYVAVPPQGTQLDWFPPESAQESISTAQDQDGVRVAAGEALLPPRDLSATTATAPPETAGVVSAPLVRRLVGAPQLVSYNIYRSTSPTFTVSDESARLIAVVPAGVTDYFDPNLSSLSGGANQPTFFYRVTAVYEQGESAPSNIASPEVAVTGVFLETIDGEVTLVLNGVSFSTFRALILIDGVRVRQTRFPEESRLGNGTSSRIEGVGALNLMIPPGQTVSVVVVNPGTKEDLSDAQYSPPFTFRRAP